MSLDLPLIRSRFPALSREGVYFDNPAGTQVPIQVLNRIRGYLVDSNANQGGAFPTSAATDALLQEARQACADFYNAARPEEIVFGPNMTSLAFHLSRSLAKTISPGDTLVVTRLDHDANISPWLRLAQDRGAHVEWVDFDVEDGTLRLETLEAALEKKPKLAAFGYASNALGTINPVKKMTSMAKEAGALVFIDAVQYAPHGVIDVQDLGCDFLVSSSYKFYGPHAGVLYGRYDLLDELEAYKVRPSSKRPPGKWETGTPNFEGIAGVLGALEYFEWLAETFEDLPDEAGPLTGPAAQALGLTHEPEFGGPSIAEHRSAGRRIRLAAAMRLLHTYEAELGRALLETLASVPGVRVYGLTDLDRLDERVPTVSFNLEGRHPDEVAAALGQAGFYVWSGNYYALSVTERLGLEDSGGMVRVGPVHYNTLDEIARFGEALRGI